MIFKIQFKDMEAYVAKMSKLEAQSEPIIKKAVYEGAGIVADAIRGNIGSVSGRLPLPLGQGLGISHMKNEGGFINVKVGFDGYYTDHTGRQVPIPLLVRSVEKGTSKIKRQPFIKSAVAASKGAAEQKMQQVIDEEIEKIMK